MARRPRASIPQQTGDEAGREGAYRLLNNRAVTAEALTESHVQATAQRCFGQEAVLVVQDTTEFSFPGVGAREGLGRMPNGGKGFFCHVALAVGLNGQPLGVLGFETWTRSGPAKWNGNKKVVDEPSLEPQRWRTMSDNAAHRLTETKTRTIQVMDREADCYETLAYLLATNQDFVIRVNHDRFVEGDENLHLSELVNQAPVVTTRELRLPSRPAASKQAPPKARKRHRGRKARTATLELRAATVEIRRSTYASRELPKTVTLQVVEVREMAPPVGEAPVHWLLYTTLPVTGQAGVEMVVDIYRQRWQVEEFFKALKTGCALEERQLESYHALRNALGLLLPVAWSLLALRHLARSHPNMPAEHLLSSSQIEVLHTFLPKLSPIRTMTDALLAIARIGGHVKSNGDPGWQVLGRGYQDLLLLEMGWVAARKEM